MHGNVGKKHGKLGPDRRGMTRHPPTPTRNLEYGTAYATSVKVRFQVRGLRPAHEPRLGTSLLYSSDNADHTPF
jgi:hypothetical protein